MVNKKGKLAQPAARTSTIKLSIFLLRSQLRLRTQQRWNMADSRVNDPSTLEPPLFIPETSLLEPLAPGAHGEEGALAGRSLAVTAVIVISSSSSSSNSSSVVVVVIVVGRSGSCQGLTQ
jgi:hypothetical protein